MRVSGAQVLLKRLVGPRLRKDDPRGPWRSRRRRRPFGTRHGIVASLLDHRAVASDAVADGREVLGRRSQGLQAERRPVQALLTPGLRAVGLSLPACLGHRRPPPNSGHRQNPRVAAGGPDDLEVVGARTEVPHGHRQPHLVTRRLFLLRHQGLQRHQGQGVLGSLPPSLPAPPEPPKETRQRRHEEKDEEQTGDARQDEFVEAESPRRF